MYTVFVVEDERRQREGMIKLFPWESFGCKIIGSAENGVDGLKRICSERPDIVFTDIKMPFMGGIEMMDKIKAVYTPKTVILTGYAEFEYAYKAISLGVDAYILKPANKDDIRKIIIKITEDLQNENMTAEEYEMDRMLGGMGSLSVKVSAACRYIAENYAVDLTSRKIAEAIGISADYLCRIVKAETGMSLRTLTVNFRVSMARRMLGEYPQYKVYEVAEMTGFSDYKYFYTVFSQKMNMSPTEYQRCNFNQKDENVRLSNREGKNE